MSMQNPAPQQARILVIDDEPDLRTLYELTLLREGYRVEAAGDLQQARQQLSENRFDAVITDMRLPDGLGLELLRDIVNQQRSERCVVITAHGSAENAVEALKAGAFDYLTKPVDLKQFRSVVASAVQGAKQSAPAADKTERGTSDSGIAPLAIPLPVAAEAPLILQKLVGESAVMRAVKSRILKVAGSMAPVLIQGESGTGKELVARALHRESPRSHKPFVALNTAAIPAELLESELFGHEAGAFTGAQRRHVGRFEQADRGSLFLDEIGDMPLPLQTRLLRVLAEGEFFRVGGRELIRVDVRVIAATHQDLEHLVAQGRFRADLLHRLDVVRLRLPPLRERRGDLPQLAERFLAAAAQRFGAPLKRLSKPALERLMAHDWPGNVRELENVCWRLAALAPGDAIAREDLDEALGAAPAAAGDAGEAWETLLSAWARAQLAGGRANLHADARERFDRALLEAALAHTGGRRTEAAARLGLGRNTLTRKLGPGRRRS